MDNMFGSYINKFCRELDTLAQGKLRLEAEFGNVQGLVEDLKNKSEEEISKRTEMENEFVLIKKDVDGPGWCAQWLVSAHGPKGFWVRFPVKGMCLGYSFPSPCGSMRRK